MPPIPGYATPEGTARYRDRFTGLVDPAHFRSSQGLWFSSIGLGTYLGNADDADDRTYVEGIMEALQRGCNVIDSAINYRHQRSERTIGLAIEQLSKLNKLERDEVIVATKGGYIPFDSVSPLDPRDYVQKEYIDTGIVTQDQIVEWNCIAPGYLDDQVERSRRNLNLECIDIYYLHNPEAQLEKLLRDEFLISLRKAFTLLERKVNEGKIRMYGAATWDGFRQSPDDHNYLSLSEIMLVAEDVGGADHHFRAVQLPYNFAMVEAATHQNQEVDDGLMTFMEAAQHYGIAVMTSAPTLQGKLTGRLHPDVGAAFPGLTSDVQRAIQFARSTPGVTSALVGMKQREHVVENLTASLVAPLTEAEFAKLFDHPS